MTGVLCANEAESLQTELNKLGSVVPESFAPDLGCAGGVVTHDEFLKYADPFPEEPIESKFSQANLGAFGGICAEHFTAMYRLQIFQPSNRHPYIVETSVRGPGPQDTRCGGEAIILVRVFSTIEHYLAYNQDHDTGTIGFMRALFAYDTSYDYGDGMELFEGNGIKIEYISVNADYRRQGIAEEMVKKLFQLISAGSINCRNMAVSARSAASEGLFKKLGFRELEKSEQRDDSDTNLVLALPDKA